MSLRTNSLKPLARPRLNLETFHRDQLASAETLNSTRGMRTHHMVKFDQTEPMKRPEMMASFQATDSLVKENFFVRSIHRQSDAMFDSFESTSKTRTR